MDVPAPVAGTVKQLGVKIGDRVSEGSVLLTLEADGRRADRADRSQRRARAAPAPTRRGDARPRRGAAAPAPPPPRIGAGGDRDAQVVVIGSGPGGYTAAFRAADLGLQDRARRALRDASAASA